MDRRHKGGKQNPFLDSPPAQQASPGSRSKGDAMVGSGGDRKKASVKKAAPKVATPRKRK